MNTTASLIGARIRRIDAPSPDLWAISLATAELRGTLIVSLQPGAAGIGWAEKRPHGLPATSFVQKLRKELEGGRLTALDEVGATLELSISRAQQPLALAFDFKAQNVLLYAADALLASAQKLQRTAAAALAERSPDDATRKKRDQRSKREESRGSANHAGTATASAAKRANANAVDRDARHGSGPSEGALDAGAIADDESPELALGEALHDVEQAPSGERDGAAGASEKTGAARDRAEGVGATGRADAAHASAEHTRGAKRGPRVPLVVAIALLEERGRSLLADRGEALFELRQSALLRGLRASRKKLSRKQAAIAGDADRVREVPALRAKGQVLLSNLHAIPRGAKSVKLTDWTLDPPAEVEITLDPTQHPRALAEAWFKKAKRFERGAAVAAQRAAAGEAELAVLDELEREIDGCSDLAALDVLVVRAERLGIKSEVAAQGPVRKAKEPARHVPYRTLLGAGDRPILVGKGAADNDELTREHARPHDLWLHARDVAGAHVIVPLAKNETCPQELLLDAATAAAHYSDSRGESTVDVSYTPKRYVRKPKGAPPGLVTLEREKVLRLQLEAARLARLLQTDKQ